MLQETGVEAEIDLFCKTGMKCYLVQAVTGFTIKPCSWTNSSRMTAL